MSLPKNMQKWPSVGADITSIHVNIKLYIFLDLCSIPDINGFWNILISENDNLKFTYYHYFEHWGIETHESDKYIKNILPQLPSKFHMLREQYIYNVDCFQNWGTKISIFQRSNIPRVVSVIIQTLMFKMKIMVRTLQCNLRISH